MEDSRLAPARRRFLSAAAVGGFGALGPLNINTAPRIVTEDFLPTVADSLEQYRERVRRLRPIFNATPIDVSFSIGFDFEQLASHILQTRDSAGHKPPSDDWFRKAEDLIAKGKAGTKQLAGYGKRDLQAAQAQLDSIGVIANYLKDITVLVKDSAFIQAFERRARPTIDELLQNSGSASRLVQFGIFNLQQLDFHIDAVRLYLLVAQQSFQLNDLNRAQAAVIKAKDEFSNSIFALSPMNKTQRQELTSFKTLLDGCISWLKKGGVFADSARHHSVSYVAAGLVSTVNQVLRDILPEKSALRVGCCVALITPILFLSGDPKDRFDPIFNVLTSLFPSGKNDSDEKARKSAAERLSKVDL